MAKLLVTMFAVLLAAAATMLSMANASSYTISTTVEEDNAIINQGRQGQGCRQQMQHHRQELQHCEQYLLGSSRSMRGEGGDQYYFGRAIKKNQMMPGQMQMQDFYQCCGALQMIQDQQCVCRSLESIIRSGSSEGQGQGQEQSQQFAMTQASFLPMLCGLGHTCQFQSSYQQI